MKRLILPLLMVMLAVISAAASTPLECTRFFGDEHLRMSDTKVVITTNKNSYFRSITVPAKSGVAAEILKAVEADRAKAESVVVTYENGHKSIILGIRTPQGSISIGYIEEDDEEEDEDKKVRLFISGPPEALK